MSSPLIIVVCLLLPPLPFWLWLLGVIPPRGGGRGREPLRAVLGECAYWFVVMNALAVNLFQLLKALVRSLPPFIVSSVFLFNGQNLPVKYMSGSLLLGAAVLSVLILGRGYDAAPNIRRSLRPPPPPTTGAGLGSPIRLFPPRFLRRSGEYAFAAVSLMLAAAAQWAQVNYGQVGIAEIIYLFAFPLTAANVGGVLNSRVLLSFFVDVLLNPPLVLYAIRAICKNERVIISGLRRFPAFAYAAAKTSLRLALRFSWVLLLLCAAALAWQCRVLQFADVWLHPSTFYEEHYIDPQDVSFNFPKVKRNLLVIFVESLESSFFSREQGGAFAEDMLPGVYALAQENINISGTGAVGGEIQVNGTGWTVAGIISSYAGVPLGLPMSWDVNNYGVFKEFMRGAVSLGDILSQAGYKTYFLCGSEAAFGGRDAFFHTHGHTEIFDLNYFYGTGHLPEDYRVWWGFEDRKLYGFAKEKLTAIGAEKGPFFFTLLTADTHFTDGYLDEKAETPFSSQYKNVLYDAGKQLTDFVDWARQQVWYDNTTIVIFGDHLYMDSSVFPENTSDRRILNIWINSLLPGGRVKNRRASHFDRFPTLLSSIGVTFDAPGLGLGRNISAGERSLLESLDEASLNSGLSQRSQEYESFFYREAIHEPLHIQTGN